MSSPSKSSSIITINSANSTVTNNNVFEFQLKSTLSLQNSEIALVKAFIYNSLFNIDESRFKNSKFQYIFPNGAGYDTVNVSVPSGFYTIENIIGYLQTVMFLNKHYLIDALGDPVYYINLNINIVYYKITLTCNAVPSVLPAGYTIPTGYTLPPSFITPRVVILSSNAKEIGFGALIGFQSGSFPAIVQSSNFSTNSSFTGQISPQYAFNICTNLVSQPYVNTVPNMIYPFSFTQPFGNQEIVEPYQNKFYRCMDSQFSSIIMRITDQDNLPALLNDPSAMFVLEIRDIQ